MSSTEPLPYSQHSLVLFDGKSLSELTYDELKRELTERRITEGFFVDYKRAFPKDLGKYVSSMANTYGGYIFIGIEEDEKDKTAKGFDGVPLDGDPRQKARNIISSTVVPFPPCDFGLVKFPDNKGIVIIHVRESQNPPHLYSDGAVYVRNGESSEPLKDRHSLDRLYAKGEKRKEWLARRLKGTITHEKLGQECNALRVDRKAGWCGFGILVYPHEGYDGRDVIQRDELKSHVQRLAGSPHTREAVFSWSATKWDNGDRSNEALWWSAPSVVTAHIDGLIEQTGRFSGDAYDQEVDGDHIVESVDYIVREHLPFLESRGFSAAHYHVDLHLFGMYGRLIAGKFPVEYKSKDCFEQALLVQFVIDRHVNRTKFIPSLRLALIAAAGGLRSN